MARQSSSAQGPSSADLSVEQMQKALPRLEKRVQRLQEFQPEAISTSEEASRIVGRLNADIDDALIRTFGPATVEYRRYCSAANLNWPIRIGSELSVREIVEHLVQDRAEAIDLLRTAISSLEEQIAEADEPLNASPASGRPEVGKSRKVFLVHGHDKGEKEAVARFLEKCDFAPIVLHEQANMGQTIIEKFEANADVCFAVVLLTPDDKVLGDEGEVLRARQNVVLELGYFIGRLGRDRVCALKTGNVELPSDILGVVWTDFDVAGGWKQNLAKELQAAGLSIDWNKVMA